VNPVSLCEKTLILSATSLLKYSRLYSSFKKILAVIRHLFLVEVEISVRSLKSLLKDKKLLSFNPLNLANFKKYWIRTLYELIIYSVYKSLP
jgi:hypothetical protein